MDILRTPPSRSDFIPLSEHQSQTPASFYDGPTILYHLSPGCTLKFNTRDLARANVFEGLASAAKPTANGQVNGHASEGTPNEDEDEVADQEVEIPEVDVWVTSERFILFSSSSHTGVSISYPSITLHAIQRPSPPSPSTAPALYLQLLPEANATFDDHDPDETISLYIIPNASSRTVSAPAETPPEGQQAEQTTDVADEVSKIFTALSACANLHPDPPMSGDDTLDQDDEDGIIGGQHLALSFQGQTELGIDGVYPLGGESLGGLPPPMPGSGGWITAENVGEFFDEDGNWRGRGEEGQRSGLGEGAGRTRGREDEDSEEGEGEEGTKWTRTS